MADSGRLLKPFVFTLHIRNPKKYNPFVLSHHSMSSAWLKVIQSVLQFKIGGRTEKGGFFFCKPPRVWAIGAVVTGIGFNELRWRWHFQKNHYCTDTKKSCLSNNVSSNDMISRSLAMLLETCETCQNINEIPRGTLFRSSLGSGEINSEYFTNMGVMFCYIISVTLVVNHRIIKKSWNKRCRIFYHRNVTNSST